MRKARLLLALALAALAMPLSWWRSEPVHTRPALLHFVPLAAGREPGWPASLTLHGAWQLASDDPAFSGFSTLALAGSEGFLAFADTGTDALFPRPPFPPVRPHVLEIPYDPAIPYLPDIESAAVDLAGRTIWLAYEHHNAIRRLTAAGESTVVKPAAMRDWGANSGPEAMARLADGRFLVLAERGGHALLFPGDPVAGGEPLRFTLETPGGFRPTDAAQLPDGRVLLLLREVRWTLPPFASMLAIADPARIEAGRPWPITRLATITGAALRENYEGLAVEPAGPGVADIWLISDDNRSVMQRTLLLNLRLATQTAREVAPASR